MVEVGRTGNAHCRPADAPAATFHGACASDASGCVTAPSVATLIRPRPAGARRQPVMRVRPKACGLGRGPGPPECGGCGRERIVDVYTLEFGFRMAETGVENDEKRPGHGDADVALNDAKLSAAQKIAFQYDSAQAARGGLILTSDNSTPSLAARGNPTITLMRHGKPLLSDRGWVALAGMPAWTAAYDLAGIVGAPCVRPWIGLPLAAVAPDPPARRRPWRGASAVINPRSAR